LAVARTFQTDLPHAFRECGLLASQQGNVHKARQYFDKSITVAEQQGARFEYAQTLLSRGQVGQQHGWPEAQQDLATARETLREIGADFALNNSATS
jgi:Tfp pilus assembly protein PilF